MVVAVCDGEAGRVHAAGSDSVAASATFLLALALGHGRGLLRTVTTHISSAHRLCLPTPTRPPDLRRRSCLLSQILPIQILSSGFEMAYVSTSRHREFRVGLGTAHTQVTHGVLPTVRQSTLQSK